jgi:hypothetical protein
MSAVSVLVIDCTTTGAPPPTVTEPTRTLRDVLRDIMALEPCPGGIARAYSNATHAGKSALSLPTRLA